MNLELRQNTSSKILLYLPVENNYASSKHCKYKKNRYLCEKYDFIIIIDRLEPLNIEARYPSYKERLMKSLSREYCQQLLKETTELQQWIKNKL